MHRVWLLLLAACWTGPVAEPVADDPAPAKRADKPVDLAIEYRRTPCFGQCPTFQVTIGTDGTLQYYGRDNVAVTGAQTKKLTKRQLRDLDKAVDHAHFFTLDDQGNETDQSCRKPGGGTCSFSFSVCTDTPHTVITVRRPKRGEAHTIDDAHCTDSGPAEELERAVEALVKPWIGQ